VVGIKGVLFRLKVVVVVVMATSSSLMESNSQQHELFGETLHSVQLFCSGQTHHE